MPTPTDLGKRPSWTLKPDARYFPFFDYLEVPFHVEGLGGVSRVGQHSLEEVENIP